MLIAVAVAAAWSLRPASHPEWSEAERALLATLSLQRLPPPRPDPSNSVADDPRAARLGQRLFFDPRMGGGQVSCASCHQPEKHFADGLVRGRGIGETQRNTPSIVGSQWSPWLYWDGRKDSQWSQALAPMEHPDEHGGNRVALARLAASPDYREDFEALFGPLPQFDDRGRFPAAAGPGGSADAAAAWAAMSEADRAAVNRVFAMIGKAIAAFERRVRPGETRFDRYLAAVGAKDRARQLELFSADEAAGLGLFIGEARCIECHNGPLLSNHEFHNTGLLSAPDELPDRGRFHGIAALLDDAFNCRGEFSDDSGRRCDELDFMRTGPELLGAFRTPSLRNAPATAPYGHKGQQATLADVLAHYNEAPEAMIGHNETEPLGLSARELRQLEAFLATLDAPPVIELDALRTAVEPGGARSTRY